MIAEVVYVDGTTERTTVATMAEATAWFVAKRATPKAGTFVWTTRCGDILPVLASVPTPPSSIVRK